MPQRRRTWSSASVVRPSCASCARRARSCSRCRNSMRRRRSRKSNARWRGRSLLGAAVVSARIVAAVAFVTLTTIFFVALRDETAPTVVERSAQPQDPGTSPIDVVETARVPELVAQSQQLEGLLQKLPERPRIERVSTAAMIDTIEDRIQLLDFQLSDARQRTERAADAAPVARARRADGFTGEGAIRRRRSRLLTAPD